MRKLASIQKISKLESIENADKLEKATVLGWELVVLKGEFKEGDLCLYIEIDSLIPEKHKEFEFLRNNSYRSSSNAFRIKTIKLRGQVSQGLALPIEKVSLLKEKSLKEGEDVTKLLEIRKYDPEEEANQKRINDRKDIINNKFKKYLYRNRTLRNIFFPSTTKPFPAFIQKTDEPRIQSFSQIEEKEKGNIFIVTEKLDGTSATFYLLKNPKRWQFWKPYIFGCCSRNYEVTEKDKKVMNGVYWKMAKKYSIKDILMSYMRKDRRALILQGEIIGQKVQGNKYKLTGNMLYVFNFISINDNNRIVDYSHSLNLLFSNKLNICPTINSRRIIGSIKDEVELSKGKSLINKDTTREGLVYRRYEDGKKIMSFKVINPDFLIEYNL